MKKLLSVLLAAMLACSVSAPAFAGWSEFREATKAFFMSPKQIPDNMKEEYDAAEFKPFGLVGGLLKGLFYTGKDMVTSIGDIVTSPLSDQ